VAILERRELEESPLADLHAIASELGVEGYRRLRREELIDALLAHGGDGSSEDEESDDSDEPAEPDEIDAPAPEDEDVEEAAATEEEPEVPPPPRREPEEVRSGVLDILPNGSGFMRPDPLAHSREDVYVSPAQIRRCELRPGDELTGPVREPRRSERYPSLVHVETVNGQSADPPPERPHFDELTPVFATERLTAPEGLEAVPFGKGSRVSVGGPPGSGVTTLLRRIALSLASSDPELQLTVVLAGVRPEEVTEWRRDGAVSVAGGGFDRPAEEQSQVAEVLVERAKRTAESGGDAAIVLDSLDALSPAAARRVFGAARNLEEAGSITVIAATGGADELRRLATTRVVLEPREPGASAATLAPASGTLRADLLG
jgi:transcription termination factor Rho